MFPHRPHSRSLHRRLLSDSSVTNSSPLAAPPINREDLEDLEGGELSLDMIDPQLLALNASASNIYQHRPTLQNPQVAHSYQAFQNPHSAQNYQATQASQYYQPTQVPQVPQVPNHNLYGYSRHSSFGADQGAQAFPYLRNSVPNSKRRSMELQPGMSFPSGGPIRRRSMHSAIRETPYLRRSSQTQGQRPMFAATGHSAENPFEVDDDEEHDLDAEGEPEVQEGEEIPRAASSHDTVAPAQAPSNRTKANEYRRHPPSHYIIDPPEAFIRADMPPRDVYRKSLEPFRVAVNKMKASPALSPLNGRPNGTTVGDGLWRRIHELREEVRCMRGRCLEEITMRGMSVMILEMREVHNVIIKSHEWAALMEGMGTKDYLGFEAELAKLEE